MWRVGVEASEISVERWEERVRRFDISEIRRVSSSSGALSDRMRLDLIASLVWSWNSEGVGRRDSSDWRVDS